MIKINFTQEITFLELKTYTPEREFCEVHLKNSRIISYKGFKIVFLNRL